MGGTSKAGLQRDRRQISAIRAGKLEPGNNHKAFGQGKRGGRVTHASSLPKTKDSLVFCAQLTRLFDRIGHPPQPVQHQAEDLYLLGIFVTLGRRGGHE